MDVEEESGRGGGWSTRPVTQLMVTGKAMGGSNLARVVDSGRCTHCGIELVHACKIEHVIDGGQQ